MRQAAAVILAAGKSTRMKSESPKVLHELCGRPMLSYVLDACRGAGVERLLVVVGHRREQVMQTYADATDITWVHQAEQHGTGHAVMVCAEALAGFSGQVLVIAGDMPLIHASTLRTLLDEHERTDSGLALATTVLERPEGYGRIVRDAGGELVAIVEHKDCTADQLEIHEVNPSYYCFDGPQLFPALDKLTSANEQGEYYITDTIAVLRDAGKRVSAIAAVPAEDAMGINSRADLAEVNRVMQDRIQRRWMAERVTIVDPVTTWIEDQAELGAETVVFPFSFIGTGAQVGDSCRIGPLGHVARGARVAAGTVVEPATNRGREVLGGQGVVVGRRESEE
ncbi:MAG: bifunctional N-acetylglucosamine-1-phosphate uridyltransferase/glucosamine-1-phosphate acetyltransferase [bacterium]|nr:bifunctional N-acetylglucosamine-1-phosphate uridyltransferase/glucosamine-1-phosphate acetyltransferase [bacterium]